MAGAGGGGRGGGGGRSRGRSGGSGGGFRYTYHPGQGWQYHGGQGGGCFSRIIVPIGMLFVIIVEMVSGLFGCTSFLGTNARYNEDVYQDYADTRYSEVFGSSSAYEDNLMLSVLVDDDHYSYYYIAWVGDHIVTDINHMLGSEETALGDAMDRCINRTSYKYSLDSNLAQVMEMLTEEVEALGLATSFKCSEDHGSIQSALINDSHLELNASTVNTALTAFTDATGIPTVIVVEDMDDVFTDMAPSDLMGLLFAGCVLIVILIGGIRGLLGKKSHSFDDQY